MVVAYRRARAKKSARWMLPFIDIPNVPLNRPRAAKNVSIANWRSARTGEARSSL
ncbi:hypothetical protein D3C83_252050 [compost metagenome]